MSEDRARLIAIRSRYNMTCPYSGERADVFPHNEYSVLAQDPADLGGELVGLVLTTAGRFGNALSNVPGGIAVAQQKGLRYVRLPDVEGLCVDRPVTIREIQLLPTDGPLPQGGVFLKGPCDLRDFPGVAPIDVYDCIQAFVRPVLNVPTRPPATELVIHIRSGDIFSNYVHPDYVQPPLSFYTLVIKDLCSRRLIDRVRVVFEDRLNPCVDALESYLSKTSIKVVMQSQDFTSDLVSMIDCNHYCFGFGTLGPAVCLLSSAMATVHHFQGQREPSGIRARCAAELNEYTIIDEYIPKGTWANTDAQRALMVEYPEKGLRRHEVQVKRVSK